MSNKEFQDQHLLTELNSNFLCHRISLSLLRNVRSREGRKSVMDRLNTSFTNHEQSFVTYYLSF